MNSIEFEDGLLQKMEGATPPRMHVKKLTDATLVDQCFIALVAAIVRKETKKALNVELKKEDRRQKLVETAYGICALSTSPSECSPKNISNERTNRNTYSEIS